MCLPVDAINLIINSAIMQHVIKTGTLDMHDLDWFYHLINWQNLYGISYQDFAIYQRKNLTYEKLSCSLIHIIYLGKTILHYNKYN